MKIPIFEEILLSEVSTEKIRAIVSDSKIGKVPSFLNLTSLKKDEMERLILTLEQMILEHNLHPLFPYPLYIVSAFPVKSIFPWVKTVADLPEHYFKKIKRPNNKELQLLNKLSLKVNKIRNLEIYKIMNEFKDSAQAQRKLYNETKELYFLEVLNSSIFDRPKK